MWWYPGKVKLRCIQMWEKASQPGDMACTCHGDKQERAMGFLGLNRGYVRAVVDGTHVYIGKSISEGAENTRKD